MVPKVTAISLVPTLENCVASVVIARLRISPLTVPLVTAVRTGFASPYVLVWASAATVAALALIVSVLLVVVTL